MLFRILTLMLLALESTVLQAQEQQIYITEIMAANDGTPCITTDGSYDPDWIELHNVTSQPIDLKDWYLTDDDRPGKQFRWQFPTSFIVSPKGYQLVYTMAKGSHERASVITPNFRLSYCGGETLILSRPNKEEEDRLNFSSQTPGISFGRTVDLKETRYFDHPTPGVSNDSEPPERNCKMPRPGPTRIECY